MHSPGMSGNDSSAYTEGAGLHCAIGPHSTLRVQSVMTWSNAETAYANEFQARDCKKAGKEHPQEECLWGMQSGA